MKIYSDVRRQRIGQVVGDLMLVGWIAVCAGLGLAVYRVTNLLGAPGRKVAEAGDGLAGDLHRMAEPAGKVPAVGEELRAPLDGAAGAATKLADAGRDQAAAVEQFALLLAGVTFALPVLFALLIWLPRRIRFSRRATAAQKFIDSAADLDLFALRAMTNQPMRQLAKISDDPVQAWRSGDAEVITRLADLELRSCGLKAPPGKAATPERGQHPHPGEGRSGRLSRRRGTGSPCAPDRGRLQDHPPITPVTREDYSRSCRTRACGPAPSAAGCGWRRVGMQTKLDTLKADVLGKAVAAGAHGHEKAVHAGKLATFLERYYRYVAAEDICQRQPTDVLGAARHHYRSAAVRPQGTGKVQVFTPTLEEHGWSANGHTVVEIVIDDMPFLVDSASMVIAENGLALHLLVHPQFVVRRDLTGALQEIIADEQAAADEHDLVRESWMHLEIDRIADPAEHRRLERDLLRVLNDVREAVEDWPKMHDKAVAIAEGLDPARLPVQATEVEEARELLEWLADEHFTFLGYREYSFTMKDDQGVLRGVPGTGLGILRKDPKLDEGAGLLPPEVSAKAREKKLLILTKANSRSTVHRSSYLDYVGIKQFDDNGEPIGEQRFIGLLASTAYTESVMQVPVLKRKAFELFRMTGFEANSHSGKGLLDVLETYPRDELLQAPVEDLLPIVQTVLHLQERRAVKLFIRRDVYNRYLSCLVYLPRDRYTTAVRLKMQQILKDAIGADSVDYAAHVTESVLARVHFVVRMKHGETVGEYDAEDLERQVIDTTRAWEDDFATALHEQLGDVAATKLTKLYADAFGEAYKEDFPAGVAVTDVRILEDLPATDGLAMSLYTPLDAEGNEKRFKLYRTGSVAVAVAGAAEADAHGCRGGRRAAVRGSPRGRLDGVHLRLRPAPAGRLRGEGGAAAVVLRHLPGRLGRARGERQAERAGRPRGPHLAAGVGAAGLPEIHPPGRDAVQPGLHREQFPRARRHRCSAGAVVRDQLRPGARCGRRPGPGGGGRPTGEGDQHRAGHGQESGRGQDPALLPDRDQGDPADELLPAGPGR